MQDAKVVEGKHRLGLHRQRVALNRGETRLPVTTSIVRARDPKGSISRDRAIHPVDHDNPLSIDQKAHSVHSIRQEMLSPGLDKARGRKMATEVLGHQVSQSLWLVFRKTGQNQRMRPAFVEEKIQCFCRKALQED